ncbi:hypothetical protein SFC88_06165 [Nocardioides sp. HM23]|uniref:hypothetical protein n=1 Tax=Nocardioides bizhenqiangii TaxID=3095076 RepID=UPI002ACAFCB2|nr:hypothetical protein [Nocardioides sp. HM23]MDZ5620397.1 hypothetical protein [Nocardioides sp. HM23]
MSQQSPTPRRRHLMDPDAPRKVADPKDLERLQRVQRRVISVLIITTLIHLTVGLVLAADAISDDRRDAQVILILLGAAFFVVGIGAVRAINQKPLLTWWMLTGLVPVAAGLWWVVAR